MDWSYLQMGLQSPLLILWNRHSQYRDHQYRGLLLANEVQTEQVTTVVGDDTLHIHLPPAREIVLDLETERYVNQPSNELPWNR